MPLNGATGFFYSRMDHPVAAARAEAAPDPAQLARAGRDKADDPHPLRMPVVPARVATIRPELLPKVTTKTATRSGGHQKISRTDDTKRTSRETAARRRRKRKTMLQPTETKQKKAGMTITLGIMTGGKYHLLAETPDSGSSNPAGAGSRSTWRYVRQKTNSRGSATADRIKSVTEPFGERHQTSGKQA